MEEILHILNGDNMVAAFNDTGLEGDTLIWREILCEGPVTKNIDAAFWETRARWISKTYNDTPENYLGWVSGELSKLNQPYREINLWFEYDLHCQINLLAAMQMLKQQTDLTERTAYLISPDSFPGVDNFRGMGQLNAEQLEYLFDGRIQLTAYDFVLADEAWALYVANKAIELQQWIDTNPFWGTLHHLKQAMQQHQQRIKQNN